MTGPPVHQTAHRAGPSGRKKQDEEGSARRNQIGSGERGSKIRTYNFRENRVTDHRVGVTLYNLDRVLEGQLDPLIDALVEADALQSEGVPD